MTYKKMLSLSVHQDNKNAFLRIEREDYYCRLTRRNMTEHSYEEYTASALASNPEFYQNTLPWLTVFLFDDISIKKNFYESYLLYPHFRSKNKVLRIDQEAYFYKKHREFCEDFYIPILDFDKLRNDEIFQSQFARILLKYLHLDNFFVNEPQKEDREAELREKNEGGWRMNHLPPLY